MPSTTRFLSLLVCLSLVACGSEIAEKPARSVLLITLDTLRADHVGAYGSRVATPTLDALAARGTLFEQAMTPVPLTAPAHSTMFTGLYPWHHGVLQNGLFPLSDEYPLVAEKLADAGLDTAAFVAGKPISGRFGLNRGFATYDDFFGHTADGRERVERRADEVIPRAESWLREHGARPFFLWVHLFDAHTPHSPPEPYASRYLSDQYAGEIAFLDGELGKLLAVLRELKLESTTLVVVAGDHGEGLGDHGEAEHGVFLYEEVLRIPLIIAGPGVAVGSRVDDPVSLVDLSPTMLAALGMTTGDGDGIDLGPLLRGGSLPLRARLAETVYPEAEFGWSRVRAVRHGTMKAIDVPRPELYDLARDPYERNDLARERPDELEKLLAHLQSLPNLTAPTAMPDADTMAALEGLGYLAGGAPRAADAERGADPKDRIDDYQLYWKAYRLGSRSDREEDKQRAIGMFQKLVAGEPRNPQFRYRLATMLALHGRNDEAEGEYRQLFADHPTWPLAAQSLAKHLTSVGRGREAAELLDLFLQGQPQFIVLRDPLALAYRQAGDLEKAIEVARELTTMLPNDISARLLVGHLAGERGLRDESLAAFEHVLALDPGNSRASLSMSRVLVSLGRGGEAVAVIRAGREAHPQDRALADEERRLASYGFSAGASAVNP